MAKCLKLWWAMTDSNRRHLRCKRSSLIEFAAKKPEIAQERCGNIATYLCGFCAEGGAACS